MAAIYNHLMKLFILSNVLLLLGLLMNYALPPVVRMYVNTQIVLTEDSQSYPAWKEIPVPAYQRFYFFNVTNAQDVEQRGHKPHLEEIGPFTYRSDWTKQDIERDDLKNTISFKHFKEWHFEPDLSIADHRLQIVTINAPLAITLTLIQSASSAVRLLVTFSLDGLSDGFFTKRSVKQLLFDGYPDLLTTFGPLLNAEMLSQGGHFGYMNAKNSSEDGFYEINTGVDDLSKLNTISRFNGRSKLPYWNQQSVDGHDKANQEAAAASAPPNQCNSLEGATTGEMFPPVAETNQTFVKLFQPDFCRVWRLDFNSSFEQEPGGLQLNRYIATRDVFRNSSDLPENSCFFSGKRSQQNILPPASGINDNRIHHQQRLQQPEPRQLQRVQPQASTFSRAGRQQQPQQLPQSQVQQNRRHHNNNISHNNMNNSSTFSGGGSNNNNMNNNHNNNNIINNNRHHSPGNGHPRVRHEWPAGVFTLAPCKFNAPIYVSMPHFLDADPSFALQVDGLQPDPDKHEFYVDLEPKTGSPVTLAVRAQINVAISKPPGLVRFRNIPEIMFPVFWQEFTVNVTGPLVDQLRLASRGAEEAVSRVSYSFLLLGTAILITSGVFYLHFKVSAP